MDQVRTSPRNMIVAIAAAAALAIAGWMAVGADATGTAFAKGEPKKAAGWR